MRALLPFQGWRLTFFQGVMFAVFLLFSLQMYNLQIVNQESAQIAADENRLQELPLPADRGVMFDRYGQTLAGNSPAYNVTVIPAALPDDEAAEVALFSRLSALTGVPPTVAFARESGSTLRSIEELVAEGRGIAPFRPVVIARDVERHVMLQIREESYDLPGVGIETVAVREYPYGSLMSHIIGYMGPVSAEEAEALRERGFDPRSARTGYDGLELSLEGVLAGERGSELREVDVAGEVQSVLQRVPSVGGQNLRLTIDVELQAAAEQALIDRITLINTEAQRIVTEQGVVIAMNPMTGEILAMVSVPSYDNSRFARGIDGEYYLEVLNNPRRPLLNQAVGAAYPPGSGWKLITSAGVLEEGVIDPLSTLNDPGDLLVANFYAPNDRAADQRFVCWNREGHGRLDMRGAIAQSCNVYFYQVGGGNPAVSPQVLRPNGLGINDLFRYATALGIGSYSGIELLAEIPSRMPDPDWKRITRGENWSTGDTYNAAFGQGYINVTPLQLLNSVAAIVNDGTLYQPTLIRDYLDEEGNVSRPFEPIVLRTVSLSSVAPGQDLTLLLLEDMIVQGPNSLACVCEPQSASYNPNLCDPANYRARVDINPDEFGEDWRFYNVHVPDYFRFGNSFVCEPNRWDSGYTPAFLSSENLQIVRDGMRLTITEGTAGSANLPYIEVAGKTGTAQYCDNVAQSLGLCQFGAWPAHAWFNAYAPYENPEILIVGFIYNGNEGSGNALPVVVEVLEAYVRLRNERENLPQPPGLGGPLPPQNPGPSPLEAPDTAPPGVEEPPAEPAG